MKNILALSVLLICQFSLTAQPAGAVVEWNEKSSHLVAISGQVLTNATAVAVGGGHCLALKNDGTVVGWGWNFFGQATGVRSDPSKDGSDKASGLVTIDGQVLSNVTAVAAGRMQSVAVKNDGTIVIWGVDEVGRKIDPPRDLTNAITVSAGWEHLLVLKKDGTVITLGTTKQPPNNLSNVVGIVAGKGYGFGAFGNDLALKNDGSVIDWGLRGMDRESDQLKALTNITAIASSGATSFALTRDGKVFGWGINEWGQTTGVPTTNSLASGFVSINGELLSNVLSITAGENSSLALKKDGTVVLWGNNTARLPKVPNGLSNVVAIATGDYFSLAITTNPVVAERFRRK